MTKRSHPAHRMSQYGPSKPDSPRDNSQAQKRTDKWISDLGFQQDFDELTPDQQADKIGWLNGKFIGYD